MTDFKYDIKKKLNLPPKGVQNFKHPISGGIVTFLGNGMFTVSQVLDIIATKFQRLLPCFRVDLFSWTGGNTVRQNRKWKIKDGGRQSGSTYILARILDSKAISTANSMFSRSSNPLTIDGENMGYPLEFRCYVVGESRYQSDNEWGVLTPLSVVNGWENLPSDEG